MQIRLINKINTEKGKRERESLCLKFDKKVVINSTTIKHVQIGGMTFAVISSC